MRPQVRLVRIPVAKRAASLRQRTANGRLGMPLELLLRGSVLSSRLSNEAGISGSPGMGRTEVRDNNSWTSASTSPILSVSWAARINAVAKVFCDLSLLVPSPSASRPASRPCVTLARAVTHLEDPTPDWTTVTHFSIPAAVLHTALRQPAWKSWTARKRPQATARMPHAFD